MTRILTLTVALWLLLLLTSIPVLSSSQPKGMTLAEWVILVKAYSIAYGVDPNLALAIAETEGSKGNVRFRFGLHGRYWLPFGIYKGCNVPRANTPGGNAEAGIRALARHLRKCGGNLRAALHRYNAEPRGFEAYYRKICRLTEQNREDPRRWQ